MPTKPVAALSLLIALLTAGCAPAPTVEGKPTSGQTATRKPTALPPAPPEGYLLRVKETKGTKFTYKWTNDASSRPSDAEWEKKLPAPYNKPGSMNVQGTLTWEVADVKDGVYTFKSVSDTTEGTGVGHGVEQAKEYVDRAPTPQTIKVNERWTKPSEDDFYDPLTNSFHRLFPEKPVKVGDSWTYKPFPQAKDAKATLVGAEEVAGRKALHIKVDLPGAFPSSKDVLNIWVDPTNGRIVKVDMLNTQDEQGLYVENRYVQEIKTDG